MIGINEINLKECTYYGNVLTDYEMIRIGIALKDFNRERKNFVQFRDELLKMGINVNVVLRDTSTMKLAKSVRDFQERVKNNTIISDDVHFFLLSSDRYKNAKISYDRLMIEKLANYGDEEAISTLTNLERWEKAHSFRSRK